MPVPEEPTAPETAPDATTAADPQAPESAAPAESSGTSTEESGFEPPFRLEDVDPAYRADVERYVKQTQGAFTRKTQELAAERAAIAEAKALYDRLESDDEREPALRELLGRYGIELESDEDPQGQADTATPPADQSDLEARLAAIEARTQADEQDKYVAMVQETLEDGFSTYAESLGVDALPDTTRQHLMALVRAIPPKVINGRQLPDVESAIVQFEAVRAAEVQAYIDSKRTADVDASGGSGSPKVDLKDPRERAKAAAAIVGRHLGG